MPSPVAVYSELQDAPDLPGLAGVPVENGLRRPVSDAGLVSPALPFRAQPANFGFQLLNPGFGIFCAGNLG